MSISNTELVASYQEGYEAFAEGFNKNYNPYNFYSELYKSWNAGYEMAKDDRSEYLDSINPLGND